MIVKVDIIIFGGNGFEETKETQQLRAKTSNSTDSLYALCVRERERTDSLSDVRACVEEREREIG